MFYTIQKFGVNKIYEMDTFFSQGGDNFNKSSKTFTLLQKISKMRLKEIVKSCSA